jgi:hypothetical protein
MQTKFFSYFFQHIEKMNSTRSPSELMEETSYFFLSKIENFQILLWNHKQDRMTKKPSHVTVPLNHGINRCNIAHFINTHVSASLTFPGLGI